LNDDTIVFVSPGLTSLRFHWPMHGPHAFARTVPPIFANVSTIPSRLIV